MESSIQLFLSSSDDWLSSYHLHQFILNDDNIDDNDHHHHDNQTNSCNSDNIVNNNSVNNNNNNNNNTTNSIRKSLNSNILYVGMKVIVRLYYHDIPLPYRDIVYTLYTYSHHHHHTHDSHHDHLLQSSLLSSSSATAVTTSRSSIITSTKRKSDDHINNDDLYQKYCHIDYPHHSQMTTSSSFIFMIGTITQITSFTASTAFSTLRDTVHVQFHVSTTPPFTSTTTTTTSTAIKTMSLASTTTITPLSTKPSIAPTCAIPASTTTTFAATHHHHQQQQQQNMKDMHFNCAIPVTQVFNYQR